MSPDPLVPAPNQPEGESPDAFNAVLFGAAITCLANLVPYIAVTVLAPPVAGGIAAVWWRTRRQKLSIPIGKAALLALGAAILGGLAWVLIYDAMWLYFDYRHGDRETAAVALAFAEWIGGADARQAAEIEMIKSQQQGLTVMDFLLQVLGVLFVSGLFAPAAGAFSAFLMRSRERR